MRLRNSARVTALAGLIILGTAAQSAIGQEPTLDIVLHGMSESAEIVQAVMRRASDGLAKLTPW